MQNEQLLFFSVLYEVSINGHFTQKNAPNFLSDLDKLWFIHITYITTRLQELQTYTHTTQPKKQKTRKYRKAIKVYKKKSRDAAFFHSQRSACLSKAK